MFKWYCVRLCGGTWEYCDGECETCPKAKLSVANKTETLKERRASDETD